jgi:hypothetical protein
MGGSSGEQEEDGEQMIIHLLLAHEAVRQIIANIKECAIVRVGLTKHLSERGVETVEILPLRFRAASTRKQVILGAECVLDGSGALAGARVGMRGDRDQLNFHALRRRSLSAGVGDRRGRILGEGAQIESSASFNHREDES